MLGHEILKVLLRGHAGAMLAQQHVEIVKHLGDGCAIFIGGTLQFLFHAGEALV